MASCRRSLPNPVQQDAAVEVDDNTIVVIVRNNVIRFDITMDEAKRMQTFDAVFDSGEKPFHGRKVDASSSRT